MRPYAFVVQSESGSYIELRQHDTIREQVLAMLRAREAVLRFMPEYWPAVEAGIATMLTLLLKDSSNPCALVYVGPPSGGKTVTIGLFTGATCAYLSDKFTPASFVSHASSVDRDLIREIDLLPRIRYHCLLTPELSTMFRKGDEQLQMELSTIIRVLDGEGFTSDSGTHGRRGYFGDYLFSWIGASTPLPRRTWKVMAQLGSRMLFFNLPGHARSKEQKVHELLAKTRFSERREICATLVSEAINQFLPDEAAVRTVDWPLSDDEDLIRAIVDLADLLSVCRRVPENGGHLNTPYTFTPQEDSSRATALLFNLARARAIAYGRRTLLREDLVMVVRITLSSMPEDRGPILHAIIGGHCTATDIATMTSLSYPTVVTKADQLVQLAVLEKAPPFPHQTYQGRPASRFQLTAGYQWLLNFSKIVNP
jgi:hypothetical protein